MKIVTSVSGGRTSAYVAANYPSDDLVFALVRIEDNKCLFPDAAIRKVVEDKIQAPFVGTAEDDLIIYTMLDLEQYVGKKIHWVTGPTYDSVIKNHHGGGYLPNQAHRYCTTVMKMEPIFNWWMRLYGMENPVLMNIGYRASEREIKRANKMLEELNIDGLSEMKATFEKHPNGDNKWMNVPWRRPQFPLIEDGILKPAITEYWKGKPVRFADYNNCVGCFSRDPLFLRFMFQQQPEKMNWFRDQEQPGMQWKPGFSYARIQKIMPQHQLYSDDFNSCDAGNCEIE